MHKILIADDSTDLLEVLSMLLKMHHYETETVNTGGQLLDKLQASIPSLLLLDVRFGGADGRQLCKMIKQENPSLPVILLSGSTELLSDFKHFKADAIVEKPFDIHFVIDQIEQLL